MIIYNITINIDASIHEEWLQWMTRNHIPDVMQTGMFSESKFLRVLSDNESGGFTYCVQYTCESMERFKQYEDIFAPTLRGEYNIRYKDKFVAFRTLLETVE